MVKERDAQMELVDALLTQTEARSVAGLSLSPFFRRQWPSVYTALDRGQVDEEELRRVCVSCLPKQERALWVADASTWPRPEAWTLPERGFHHVATTTANTPVGIGHRYSSVVAVPEERGSWALPLSHERIPFGDSEVSFAAGQVRRLVQGLTCRPLLLADSLYAGPLWLNETADLNIDTLARLRPNRTLYRRPTPRSGPGRPRLDGSPLNLRRADTWHDPDERAVVDDPELGRVNLTVWRNLHFRKARGHEVCVIQVTLSKPCHQTRRRPCLWLMYAGQTPLNPARDWRYYLRRYTIEHWYRFLKSQLLWTSFAGTALHNTQLWSHLVTVACWQLWLARRLVADQRLPWEKPVVVHSQLTPGRVRRSFAPLLAVIGTPAQPPKPRGKSPGRSVGAKLRPRARYPALKKEVMAV